MNILNDIITYVRRIVKTPSNSSLSNDLIIDYINRFWVMDLCARMQHFDLKKTYQFLTTPGIDKYNMPMYNFQTEGETDPQIVSFYPVYQGFMAPARINGINVPFYTQDGSFYNLYPNYLQQQVQAGTGDGTEGPYPLQLPFFPAIPGHVDMQGIVATGNNQDPILDSLFNDIVPVTSVTYGVIISAVGENGQNIMVADSGQFLDNNTDSNLYGMLMEVGKPPLGNLALGDGINPNVYNTNLNTVNYNTGAINVMFNDGIPDGTPIMVQSYSYQQGLPRAILFYNNVLTLRSPPDKQYLVELEAYMTPAVYLASEEAVPFAYMAEYIARGAARKILSDTGDIEQFQFYEPLFIEQEQLVWKRSQRQFTSTRTETIYSNIWQQANYNNSLTGM